MPTQVHLSFSLSVSVCPPVYLSSHVPWWENMENIDIKHQHRNNAFSTKHSEVRYNEIGAALRNNS